MCMCAHMLEHVCIWRPDNFSCHSSSGLSLAWPGIIPVLGGDWLAWLARELQGSSCNQPQCCAYICVSHQIRCDICEDPGNGTCLCGKHFTDWAVSPPLFCSLTWVLGMLHRFFLKLQKLVSEKEDGELILWPEVGAVETLCHHTFLQAFNKHLLMN